MPRQRPQHTGATQHINPPHNSQPRPGGSQPPLPTAKLHPGMTAQPPCKRTRHNSFPTRPPPRNSALGEPRSCSYPEAAHPARGKDWRRGKRWGRGIAELLHGNPVNTLLGGGWRVSGGRRGATSACVDARRGARSAAAHRGGDTGFPPRRLGTRRRRWFLAIDLQ